MRVLTLKEIHAMSVILELTEYNVQSKRRGRDRLLGTKILRRGWSVYRRLHDATFRDTPCNELLEQLVELENGKR